MRGGDFPRGRSRITWSISTACARPKDLLSRLLGAFLQPPVQEARVSGAIPQGACSAAAGANEMRFAAGKSQSPRSWTADAAAVRLPPVTRIPTRIPRSRNRFTADEGPGARSSSLDPGGVGSALTSWNAPRHAGKVLRPAPGPSYHQAAERRLLPEVGTRTRFSNTLWDRWMDDESPGAVVVPGLWLLTRTGVRRVGWTVEVRAGRRWRRRSRRRG